MIRTKVARSNRKKEAMPENNDTTSVDFMVCPDCGSDVIDGVCKGCKRKREIKKEQESEMEDIFKTLTEGDKGTGIIRIHERGLTEQQVKNTTPFGWEPVELSTTQLALLEQTTGKKLTGAYNKAKTGDSSGLAALKTLFNDWDDLTANQRAALVLASPVSIHTDWGLKSGDWTGYVVFTPGNQFQENGLRLAQKEPEIKLKGDAKPLGEHMWEKGSGTPYVLKPGEAGATKNTYGRWLIRSKFKFTAGVQGSKFKEIIIHSGPFKGRWIWTLIPEGKGGPGGWLLSRPADQEPKSEKLKKSVPVETQKMDIRFLKTTDEKQLVTGIVLKPENRDAQKHIYNDEVVEETAHDFLSRYNTETKLGKEHSEFFAGQDLQLVESWISPTDMEINGKPIKKGTWVITVKVNDDELWQEVKTGVVKGFSVGGRAVMSDG